MVQCIAKMRLGWHCLAIHTGRYNGIVREDRVCRLCQTLGYWDDTTGSIPVEDLVHFMLDCRVLHPVRDNFPLFFKPTSLPGQSKDSHVKFILNHSDHVQVVRCIITRTPILPGIHQSEQTQTIEVWQTIRVAIESNNQPTTAVQ